MSVTIGEQVARWLEDNIKADYVYDHLIVDGLAEYGIEYNEQTHLLLFDGVLTELPVYTPAQLVARGVDWLSESVNELTMGSDIIAACHELMWPTEMTPSRLLIEGGNVADLTSIAQREAVGHRPGRASWFPRENK